MEEWKIKLNDCLLPGTTFSGLPPEGNGDDMFCCNNPMIINDQNVWTNFFKPSFWKNYKKMFPVNETIKQNEASFYVKELMIITNF